LTAINFCRHAIAFIFARRRNARSRHELVRRTPGTDCAAYRTGELSTKENAMRMQLRAGTLVLALLGGIGLAAGQGMPGGAGAQEKFNLSKSKEDTISQGLKNESAQSSPGYQGDVGSKPPDSLAQKQLPNDVTAQVPETKTYLFIKLPDDRS
jgi:hypothetical protein